METIIPKTTTVLTALLKADLTTQWRNRRAVVMSILLPLIILVSWKGMGNGPFILSNSLSYGLIAIGLLGYSNSIARDRDKGIFQRLRVAPAPNWTIMGSRLLVQLIMIFIVTTAIFLAGYQVDKITLTPAGYVITYFAAIIGAAVYLSLGQLIVGLIKNPETVNSTSRLVFVAFIMIGMVGTIYAAQGKDLYYKELAKQVTEWSPYGAVNIVMAAAMQPEKWAGETTNALLATVGYILVFTTIGINKFKWDTK